MRRACIDIGSNTTRLLVGDCDGQRLLDIHQERAFTKLGRGVQQDGMIAAAKISEVVEVVSAQHELARKLGVEEIHGVATAAIRRASNGRELVDAIRKRCGLEIEVLSEQAEARLAFVGAARTLGHVPDGSLGVVDVGGGSSELVVGIVPDEVSWCTSFCVGSGDLAEHFLRSDPPSRQELEAARAHVRETVEGIDAPRPAEAVAVGGSAASLQRLAGPVLDAAAFARALAVLEDAPCAQIARRFGLDVDRVRLLPARLLILQAASRLLGSPLHIGQGGVREGVLFGAGG